MPSVERVNSRQPALAAQYNALADVIGKKTVVRTTNQNIAGGPDPASSDRWYSPTTVDDQLTLSFSGEEDRGLWLLSLLLRFDFGVGNRILSGTTPDDVANQHFHRHYHDVGGELVASLTEPDKSIISPLSRPTHGQIVAVDDSYTLARDDTDWRPIDEYDSRSGGGRDGGAGGGIEASQSYTLAADNTPSQRAASMIGSDATTLPRELQSATSGYDNNPQTIPRMSIASLEAFAEQGRGISLLLPTTNNVVRGMNGLFIFNKFSDEDEQIRVQYKLLAAILLQILRDRDTPTIGGYFAGSTERNHPDDSYENLYADLTQWRNLGSIRVLGSASQTLSAISAVRLL